MCESLVLDTRRRQAEMAFKIDEMLVSIYLPKVLSCFDDFGIFKSHYDLKKSISKKVYAKVSKSIYSALPESGSNYTIHR